jgi:diguanylate cyclase (GGDEF)-like protein
MEPTETPQEHLRRLRVLWELGLAHDTPQAQLERVLEDALGALGCSYVEIWSVTGGERIAAAGDLQRRHSIGGSPLARDLPPLQPRIFFSGSYEDAATREVLRSLGWPSVLVCPIQTDGARALLSFAWRAPHTFPEAQTQYVDLFADVVQRLLGLEKRQREMNDRMLIDPLTGLYNRAATSEHIAAMLSSSQRSGSLVAALYIDLDGFKAINDSKGHAFGDKVLAEAANRMRTALRRHEIGGRIGGDEFAVIAEFNDYTQIEAIARRLLEAISASLVIDNTIVRLSASIGIAIFPEDGTTAEELLEHADAAMYIAKRSRTGYAFYRRLPVSEPPSHESAPPAAAPGPDHDFILCFQPIVDARSRRPIAAEALLRWFDPVRGLVSPQSAESVPVHTQRDVMASLLKGEIYHEIAGAVPIHVNLAGASAELPAADLGDLQKLKFEISENYLVRDRDRCIEFIAAIRDRGGRVGLSDYGESGMSIRFMANLRLDFVKLGRGWMPDPAFGRGSADALRAAIAQAHGFGWSVIAESVEGEAQRQWLIAAGVDALQGYSICGPLTLRDFANWLRYRAAQ